ncbi:MAG: pseudouridylate synthase [Nitrospirae bacterium GWC2_56_14]|nr:MAG: pseudouridylate synthase [Nitrospirae bacterium GWC2_56_14]
MNTLPVLYQDEQLIAVNKPAGLLVHRSSIDRHEQENAMKIVRDQLGRWVYPVHRLDKSTSGVLLFALDQEIARRMTLSFTGGTISKEYLSIVRGVTKEAERIDYPLKDIVDKMTDQRANKDKPAKPSVTDYRRLASIELPHPVGRYSTARYSLIAVFPATGRSHQIRRHLKHIFHPILGDTTYGDGKQNDFFRRQFDCHRLLLHACKVQFLHPATGALLHIRAPLDHAFGAVLEELHWDRFALP